MDHCLIAKTKLPKPNTNPINAHKITETVIAFKGLANFAEKLGTEG